MPMSLTASEPVGRKLTSISSAKISVGKEGETLVHLGKALSKCSCLTKFQTAGVGKQPKTPGVQ